MTIASRAGQILADLRVAVSHQATCEPSRLAGESSSQRLAAAKPSKRSREVPLRTTWLTFTTPISPIKLRLIDFIATQQFDIVAKVAEEPVELPEGFGIAIQTSGNDVAGKSARLQNG